MTQTASGPVDALRAAMDGLVLEPGDAEYETSRSLWNADIDRRPALIARCSSAADVAAAVLFGTREGLEIAVRGGGHSMSGSSSVDGGLVIDLRLLNAVRVDPEARTARVGGGALLADLDAATQAYGLAVPAGVVSHTGVGGLTLGGGMGWFTRKAGLSIDNLLSAQVVTADGRIRRAAPDEHPDLFWAIRGGGGNFGVVTEFEFRLHPAGPIVQVGIQFWPLEQGRDVFRLARDLGETLPRELGLIFGGLSSPPAPFVPEQHHLQPGVGIVIVGFGSAEEHDRVLRRIRDALPPLWEFATPMPYVGLQQMLDETGAWGNHGYEKGTYLETLSDEAIEAIMARLPQKQSPLSLALLYRLDGAYSEVGDDDTAFSGGRSPRYSVFLVGLCPTPDMLADERAWVRSTFEALQPYIPSTGTYVNAMVEADEERVRRAYGPAKYERLAAIKAIYDPDNVFHRNANIKPATRG
jgi:hypothetical protein